MLVFTVTKRKLFHFTRRNITLDIETCTEMFTLTRGVKLKLSVTDVYGFPIKFENVISCLNFYLRFIFLGQT